MSRTASVIRTYYDSWTAGDFGTAVSIVRIRQVHDTAALREGGFVG